MAVPAATVKTLSTRSEAELVRSSRPPRLGQLTLAEVKQLAARARKLSDKWSGQRRSQSRVQSRKAGLGESAKNTQLKAQAFREALDNFTAQLARLQVASTGGKKTASKSSKSPVTAKHRAARASVRKELSAEKYQLNAPVRKRKAKKAAAKVAATPEQATAPKPAAKPAAKKAKKPTVGASAAAASARPAVRKGDKKPAGLSLVGQRQAKDAAKKSRLAASGLISRVRGHVIARGRRKQAIRDAKS